jgi:N-acetylmuramoyl-L-alanine amidase
MLLTTAITCLALNIYHEGRGEPELGQKIIAQTTMNRANQNSSNVCKEVVKPSQFSWTKDFVVGRELKVKGRPTDKASWIKCKAIARQALSGQLNVPKQYRSATSYHNTTVNPTWSNRMIRLGRVNRHIFYKDSINK